MFSNRSIAQEITIDRKTVLIYLHNTGFNTNLDVWMLHKNEHKKNRMDWISACDAVAKLNEVHLFLKRMVIRGKKWVTYNKTC